MRLTDDQLANLAEYLEGTCRTLDAALDHFDLEADVNEVESQLLDHNVEKCQGCGWWMEPCELVSEDGENAGRCEDCRED